MNDYSLSNTLPFALQQGIKAFQETKADVAAKKTAKAAQQQALERQGVMDQRYAQEQTTKKGEFDQNLALKRQEIDASKANKALQAGNFNANQLRDEFNTASKPFQTIVPMYQNIRESAITKNPTPQSDMKLIYAYMKILDPTSTVREGEYATAQNAGSIPDAVRNQWNKLQTGEKLQPTQRQQFATSALEAFRSANQMQGQHMKRYSDLATKMGVDPNQVTYDYARDFAGDLAPGAVLPWMQEQQDPERAEYETLKAKAAMK